MKLYRESNEKSDVVIIGGSASGPMAAITLRKRSSEKTVAVIRNVVKTQVSCGISNIFGIMGQVEKDLAPDQIVTSIGIEILQQDVTDINKLPA